MVPQVCGEYNKGRPHRAGQRRALGCTVTHFAGDHSHRNADVFDFVRCDFVERPLEKGPDGGADLVPDPHSDVQAIDFMELADKLGC